MSVNSKMTAIADEIRELSGTTDTKNLDEMRVDVDAANTEIAEQAELIAQIATALEGKAGGGTVLPTLNNPAAAEDIINGKEAINGDGTKITGTIATQCAQTITPTTNDQTIASGKYLTGTQTIKGDANLVADNIKSGVSIFGVAGSYEGSGGGELQCVTGTMTMSSTGTTVTGLEFTPKFVLAHMSSDLYPARLSPSVKAPYVVCGGLYTRAVAFNNGGHLISNSSKNYATLTIVDNGFTIGTGTGTFSGTFGDGDTWSYVAVG